MTDQLQIKMLEVVTSLIANNVSAIAIELQDSPEGKLSVTTGFKLKLVGSRIYIDGGLGYSRKFTDEVGAIFDIEDPRQPGLEIDKTNRAA